MTLAVIHWIPTIIGLVILAFGLWLYLRDPGTPRIYYGKGRRYDNDCDCDDTL